MDIGLVFNIAAVWIQIQLSTRFYSPFVNDHFIFVRITLNLTFWGNLFGYLTHPVVSNRINIMEYLTQKCHFTFSYLLPHANAVAKLVLSVVSVCLSTGRGAMWPLLMMHWTWTGSPRLPCPFYTGSPSFPNMLKLHYEVRMVGMWAVGILLEYFLA